MYVIDVPLSLSIYIYIQKYIHVYTYIITYASFCYVTRASRQPDSYIFMVIRKDQSSLLAHVMDWLIAQSHQHTQCLNKALPMNWISKLFRCIRTSQTLLQCSGISFETYVGRHFPIRGGKCFGSGHTTLTRFAESHTHNMLGWQCKFWFMPSIGTP